MRLIPGQGAKQHQRFPSNTQFNSLLTSHSSPTPQNNLINILYKSRQCIKSLHAPLTRHIPNILKMPHVPRRITPRTQGIPLPARSHLRTESRILKKQPASIARRNMKHEAHKPQDTPRRIAGLKRHAATITAEACAVAACSSIVLLKALTTCVAIAAPACVR